ncbi:sensor histidine kinase [Paenibacillus typhae]|uniref:histidine kinase n=1 Tax=Paenibacillus typhae TaxID=1174501 RepID=A0A1G8FD30_9BACL|nr:sensor histidine kinase [Paenibacillus typhae]MBY0013492.1 sensor histidine kinase [Paenibacillus typhae]SDH80074.1 two-component system, NarL family, sensor histidine kinase YdfH [Paenibacillus typhae]
MRTMHLFKTKNELQKLRIDELMVARIPVLIWVSLVYAASMILQSIGELTLLNALLFTIVYIVHATLHWSLYRISLSKAWLYFIIQGLLIFTCALLMPDSSPAVIIGLFPVLIGQSIGLFYQRRKIALVSLYCISMFFYTIIYVGDEYDLVLLVLLFLLMLIVVGAYASMFFQQVHARIRTQIFLEDLEKAHKKVEELTLANERQRLARDLHDTLAQGVAGLIMQLEAVNAHITQGNIQRAQEFVGVSMSQARRTLAEARLAIDNLRAKSVSKTDFEEAVRDEVHRFNQATGIDVMQQLKIASVMTGTLKEHSLQIISECLMNVAKHAKADKVWINVQEQNNRIQIEIKDNGVGFDTNVIGKKTGHYGLLGLYERVRLIGGEITIKSLSSGTRIQIEAPVNKGDGI